MFQCSWDRGLKNGCSNNNSICLSDLFHHICCISTIFQIMASITKFQLIISQIYKVKSSLGYFSPSFPDTFPLLFLLFYPIIYPHHPTTLLLSLPVNVYLSIVYNYCCTSMK